MPACPRCHQPVDTQAIACPHCRTTLKAYGHPGIPLHRATGSTSLCQTCTYDADDTCTFPQRPNARECILYHDISQPLSGADRSALQQQPLQAVRAWIKRHAGLLALMGLIIISLLWALNQ